MGAKRGAMNESTSASTQSKLGEFARPWAALTVLVGAATLGWLVAEAIGGVITDFQRELAARASCCDAFEDYRVTDTAQREYWVGVIDTIRASTIASSTALSRLEVKVEQLQTDSAARPDPFTGTDGAHLQSQVDRLEGRVQRIEQRMQP
jgi:hypothetical protein